MKIEVPGKIKSYGSVAVQLICMGFIAFSGPLWAQQPVWLLMEIAGIALGGWAIVAMRIGNFHILPDVLPNGKFVVRGPYRYIRHPMYSALLLATLVLVLDHPTFSRCAAWGALLATLVFKMNYEEELLCRRFEAYAQYRAQTKRLLPFIY